MPLSVDAFSLLGERCGDSEKIFKELKYYQTKYIADWIVKAAITFITALKPKPRSFNFPK